MVNTYIYYFLWLYVIIQVAWLIHIHGWKFIIWSNAHRHSYSYHLEFMVGSGKIILVKQKYSMKNGKKVIVRRTYLYKFPAVLKIPQPLKTNLQIK